MNLCKSMRCKSKFLVRFMNVMEAAAEARWLISAYSRGIRGDYEEVVRHF